VSFRLRPDVLLGLLIHELGHHAGIVDHGGLDLLGHTVAKHFQNYHPLITFQEEAEVGYFHKPALFRALLLNGPKADRLTPSPTKIYLADELYIYDFNPDDRALLKMPPRSSSKGLPNQFGQLDWENIRKRVL
jgi:hypothetical protein